MYYVSVRLAEKLSRLIFFFSLNVQIRHATFLIIHTEPLVGHHTHILRAEKGEGGVRGAGVTWETVRLMSHGLCLQAELRGGGASERSLCKKNKSATFFHEASQQVEALSRIKVELPGPNSLLWKSLP